MIVTQIWVGSASVENIGAAPAVLGLRFHLDGSR